jgi:carbonic anhydrase
MTLAPPAIKLEDFARVLTSATDGDLRDLAPTRRGLILAPLLAALPIALLADPAHAIDPERTQVIQPDQYQLSKSEDAMSVIDQALKSNEQYAKAYDPRLGAGPPRPAIAVVTCMDPRLSDLEGILGLKRADMDVIRNGGPAVTDEVLAELVVSTRVLGSKEIMLLNHTGCGFTTFTDEELNAKLSKLTGVASPVPMRFLSYKDPVEHTKEQIKKVRSHPWIAREVPVRGFVFDVDTGRLREVTIDGR